MRSLLLALALGGCVTTSDAPTMEFIDKVQTYVEDVCGYVPLSTSIAKIFALHDSKYGNYIKMAEAICDAVNKNKRTRAVPEVAGIPVNGRYI